MLRLALPVVVSELGWMAMGVVDTMMVGRIDVEAIGAVGVGRAVYSVVAVFGLGLLLGLDGLVSQAHGAGRHREAHLSLLHGVYLSLLIGLPAVLVTRWLCGWFGLLGIDETVFASTKAYVDAVSWSAVPLLLYFTLRRYLQAIHIVRPVMLALLTANLVNVVANRALIYGHWGFPELGVVGAAWATCIASSYLALFLLVALVLHSRGDSRESWTFPLRPDPARLARLLGLGLPAAIQLVLEVGVFALATALAGRLAPASLAAHQIALSAASVTYMVPLGVSSAAAVRVGHALGRRRPADAVRSGWAALLFGAGFMLVAATAFVLFPRSILRAFTNDPAVIGPGVMLLYLAAVFQLFDGVQVVATGALRGSGDTRTPMIWNLVGYWMIALPVGYTCCFVLGLGAVGLWCGLTTGLILVGCVLLVVWIRRSKRWSEGAAPELLIG